MPTWRGRPAVADVAVALALDVVTALPLLHRGDTSWQVWLLDQALVLPLAVRRRWPAPVFVVVGVLASVQWATGERLPADAALLVALYTVAAGETRRRATFAAGVLELGVVLASLRFAPTGDGVLGSLVFLTGLVAAAYLLGTSQQTRRDYLSSVEARAAQLEIERDSQARLSAVAERTRIAREMHDIVAHNLSVMITLADGASAANSAAPQAATAAMQQVAGTGRQALAEMRDLLGILREDGERAGLRPLPTLAELTHVLEHVRGAGLPVRLRVHGNPQPLPLTTQLTVYRTVQEALTNTLKHAEGVTAATVLLDWQPAWLDVVVSDDGRCAPAAAQPPAGLGLSGMCERVALHGGSVTAAWGPGGGWRVAARLPLSAGSGAT